MDPLTGTQNVPPAVTPNGIGGVASSGAPGKTAALDGLDKDTFLKLMVAQLRYQDPMNPMDGQEYLAQLATFAQVERLESVASAQAESIAYQRVLLSSSLVGKTVSGVSPLTGEPVTGTVDSVRFTGGSAVLSVGGHELPVDQVEEVKPGVGSTS